MSASRQGLSRDSRWRSPIAASVLSYFIAFDWRGDRITKILDFRYAPYVLDYVEVMPLACLKASWPELAPGSLPPSDAALVQSDFFSAGS